VSLKYAFHMVEVGIVCQALSWIFLRTINFQISSNTTYNASLGGLPSCQQTRGKKCRRVERFRKDHDI